MGGQPVRRENQPVRTSNQLLRRGNQVLRRDDQPLRSNNQPVRRADQPVRRGNQVQFITFQHFTALKKISVTCLNFSTQRNSFRLYDFK